MWIQHETTRNWKHQYVSKLLIFFFDSKKRLSITETPLNNLFNKLNSSQAKSKNLRQLCKLNQNEFMILLKFKYNNKVEIFNFSSFSSLFYRELINI